MLHYIVPKYLFTQTIFIVAERFLLKNQFCLLLIFFQRCADFILFFPQIILFKHLISLELIDCVSFLSPQCDRSVFKEDWLQPTVTGMA